MLVLDEMHRSGIRSKTYMMKTLFLLKEEGNLDGTIKFYSFYPYKYGPFSSVSYDDLNRLQKAGFVDDALKITSLGRLKIKPDKEMQSKARNIITGFATESKIRAYVYEKYPQYTVKSELSKPEIEKMPPAIFTIGYEGMDIDSFLNALIENQIEVVIDIRFNPFSMRFDFIQNRLRTKLGNVGIEYVHIKDLGIEGSLRKDLDSPEDYKKLFSDYRRRIREHNNNELEAVIKSGKEKRIALLCFESEKERCHRQIVADEIENHGTKVVHL